MKREVKKYCGKKITPEIFEKIKYISKDRNQEGTYTEVYENIKNIQELARLCDAKISQMNVCIGHDWFIIYIKKALYITIVAWYSIEKVENKFIQTTEMFLSFKEILLENQHHKVLAAMRLSTSYKFYRLFLEEGYFNEIYSFKGAEFEEETDEDKMLEKIDPKYQTIEDYLEDETREIYPEYEKCFYCEAFFNITEKFKKRYKAKTKK